MKAYERLLKYARIWTTSDEESTTSPTTSRQFDLAKQLVEEMKEIGIEDAYMDEFVGACFLPHTDSALFPNIV